MVSAASALADRNSEDRNLVDSEAELDDRKGDPKVGRRRVAARGEESRVVRRRKGRNAVRGRRKIVAARSVQSEAGRREIAMATVRDECSRIVLVKGDGLRRAARDVDQRGSAALAIVVLKAGRARKAAVVAKASGVRVIVVRVIAGRAPGDRKIVVRKIADLEIEVRATVDRVEVLDLGAPDSAGPVLEALVSEVLALVVVAVREDRVSVDRVSVDRDSVAQEVLDADQEGRDVKFARRRKRRSLRRRGISPKLLRTRARTTGRKAGQIATPT